jgi:hypothetical protein
LVFLVITKGGSRGPPFSNEIEKMTAPIKPELPFLRDKRILIIKNMYVVNIEESNSLEKIGW